ncbi:NAD-dependent dehydratase [Microbispora rosea subsp. aerata]|nr:NAD(P)H-binding protein [Microbispora rosea]GGO01055.1 NAD-dependent dehydratase [Microbispora rosea subsp. aerata]GIH56417.1 NAD-dependent dehydratase [Microbispora rosea subsp. aerata]GLJ84417.1 NAD-dependent dehydratase [Microbispora rosea subsp. aerata]
MRVVIAGGHGKIALRLARLLSGRGDMPVGLIRNPDQIADVEAAGAEAVVCDLERATPEEVTEALLGAGAVVFAAGAGPGSGAARKFSMDQGGSVLLAEAAQRAGVSRFIQISAMGAGAPPDPGRGEVWAAYIAAKTAAEEDLRARPLDWTILRPGRLTDEPGSGLVTLADPPLPPGEVSRDDVAAVIAALLDAPRTRHRVLELIGGGVPVDEAVRLALM